MLSTTLYHLFLSENSNSFISLEYDKCRNDKHSRIESLLIVIQRIFFWILFTPEKQTWKNVIKNKNNYFPHIKETSLFPFNFIRYILQIGWLLSFNSFNVDTPIIKIKFNCKYSPMMLLPQFLTKEYIEEKLSADDRKVNSYMLATTFITATLLAILCITQPFNNVTQFIFILVILIIAVMIKSTQGRIVSLILIALSMTVSCRYLWWRYTQTLVWYDSFSTVCGILLLMAETYSGIVLILGFVQIIWPLNREPEALPQNRNEWPCVDVIIPTYNEDLHVVKSTLYAALGIDWPKNRLRLWLLDDGNREEFRLFARETGIKYIARKEHRFAKAGNINNALRYATGEYVAIFDCDHIPSRDFLKSTIGWFIKDKKLAVLQTPHHFFSPDPFERNLKNFRKIPNEGMLFYGLLQDGNDLWNATFFCGSCAVIRRKPLDEIGGIAVETVTEDAHTSLKLHRKGYTSAYIRLPMSAGLATESLSSHIGQRIRWARGMIQIFRIDNPLLGKGLSLPQRLCYANAMLHFLSGLPRLIYLIAPLAFLIFHAYIISAPAISIILFVIPHMFLSNLTNSRIQGRYRSSFWSEIYETVLAWYITPPTIIALINPRKGKFNVTAKGGLVKNEYVDWKIVRPYLLLFFANLTGVFCSVWRIFTGPTDEYVTVIIAFLWVIYNLIIIGCSLAVSVESKQVREAHRVENNIPASIVTSDGGTIKVTIKDYSGSGVGLDVREQYLFVKNDIVALLINDNEIEKFFPAKVVRINHNDVGLQLLPMSTRQHIDFIQCTFANSNTWQEWHQSFKPDKPVLSMINIFIVAVKGYWHISQHCPVFVKRLASPIVSLVNIILSFIPRNVKFTN